MSLQQILGQEKAIRLIRKAISHERIPHAWLFSGMAHIGKYKTSLALAQTLNCLENGDDAADIVIFAVRSSMSISQISGWSGLMEKYPDCPGPGCAGLAASASWPGEVQSADFWGCRSVQSWIREFISENPRRTTSNTLIILINLNPQNLLETIVSRRQHIRFRPLSREMVLGILVPRPRWATTSSSCWFPSVLEGPQWSCIAGGAHAEYPGFGNWFPNRPFGSVHGVDASENQRLGQIKKWGMADVLENWFRDLAWIKHHLPQQDLFQFKQELEQCSKRFPEDVYQFSKYLAETEKTLNSMPTGL